MLEIRKLNSGYGELEVLREVNIEVKPNEIVALIGPNGAGKSTVIKSAFEIADV
jgi:ABC-type branched-subunit amino acid transport system ATPase component